jgi:hypothetical protein
MLRRSLIGRSRSRRTTQKVTSDAMDSRIFLGTMTDSQIGYRLEAGHRAEMAMEVKGNLYYARVQ